MQSEIDVSVFDSLLITIQYYRMQIANKIFFSDVNVTMGILGGFTT